MSSTNIIQLLDGETHVYPRAKAEGVIFDDDNNKTLDTQFGQLKQDITGEFNVAEWFQGNINDETGVFSGKNIRVTNGSAINVQNDVRIVCGGDVKITTVLRYKNGKSPVEGGTKNTDWIITQVPSASALDYVAEYDSDFPNLYVSFCKASDATADISTDYVAENVTFYSFGGINFKLDSLEKSIQSNKNDIDAVNVKVDELEEAYQKGLYYTKLFPLTVNLNPSTNLYPINIKKNSVFYVLVETSNISSLNGLYFKDENGTNLIAKYSLTNGSKIACYTSDDITGLSLYFLTSNFSPGYSSGSVKLSIIINDEQKYLSIPTTDALQPLTLIAKKGDAVKLKFNGDTSKLQKISGVYLYKDNTIISLRYNLTLNEWHTFERLADDINTLKVYTVASQVTTANSITIDIVHGSEMASEIAYENRDIILSESDKRIVVPDYYFTEQYLSKKIARVNKLAQEADGDVFVFITDEHWGYNAKVSPAIIKYLERYCNFSKVISTGDHVQNINDYQKAEIHPFCFDFMFMFGLASNKPWYSSVGNHEYLTGSCERGLFDNSIIENWKNYVFYLRNKDIVVGDSERMYYYLNDNVKKLRYVFLNAFVPEESNPTEQTSLIYGKEQFGDDQITWLTNTALNVESGWGIIIIVHYVVSVNFTNQSTNDQVISISQTASRGTKDVVNAILNYNGNGEIIAMLSGHTHRDGVNMIDDVLAQNDSSHLSNNAFFNLCSTCDAGFFPNTMAHEYIPHRILGTINECAFDFCILNRSKHRFDMVRIGDKANLVYNYSGDLEERAVVYQIQNVNIGGTKALENDIDGVALWSSSNTSVATVNNGTVTGVTAGFAKITVEDTTNHRAIVYIIKVS